MWSCPVDGLKDPRTKRVLVIFHQESLRNCPIYLPETPGRGLVRQAYCPEETRSAYHRFTDLESAKGTQRGEATRASGRLSCCGARSPRFVDKGSKTKSTCPPAFALATRHVCVKFYGFS